MCGWDCSGCGVFPVDRDPVFCHVEQSETSSSPCLFDIHMGEDSSLRLPAAGRFRMTGRGLFKQFVMLSYKISRNSGGEMTRVTLR
jgi:hypothetical protein